jgi:hypothetical protein
MEIVNLAACEYNFYRIRLKPDQSINLICTIFGKVYEVTSLDSQKIDIVEVKIKTDGRYIFITASVEQYQKILNYGFLIHMTLRHHHQWL